MDNDFLDIDEPQRATDIQFTEVTSKLIAYTVVTALDIHPNRESLAPMLVVKKPGFDYEMSADLAELTSVQEVLDSARVVLNEDNAIQAYAVVIDSVDEFPDFPEARPLAEDGQPFQEGTPYIAVYMGERGDENMSLIIQAYAKRFFRGGATPLGAPLILDGPASLFA